MSDVRTLLEMDVKSGLLFIIAILVVITFLIQKWDWLLNRFGIVSKRKLIEEAHESEITELRKCVADSELQIAKMFECMSELKDELRDDIKLVSDSVVKLQSRMDENEISKLSDRITQSYRYYNDKKQMTAMEKWAFDNLVNSYMRAGGDSFVDTKVIPASKDWVINDE